MSQMYRHLQYDERCLIHTLHQRGASASAIAAQRKRHKSTVCRELRRNTGTSGYRHKQAQQLAQERRSKATTGPRKVRAACPGRSLRPFATSRQDRGFPRSCHGNVSRVAARWACASTRFLVR